MASYEDRPVRHPNETLMEWAQRHWNWRDEMMWGDKKSPPTNLPYSKPPGRIPKETVEPTCVYLGNQVFEVGSEKISVSESEAKNLEILIDMGAATTKQLQDKLVTNPSMVFKAIRKHHPPLAPYITLPGGIKGRGFSTTIRRATAG